MPGGVLEDGKALSKGEYGSRQFKDEVDGGQRAISSQDIRRREELSVAQGPVGQIHYKTKRRFIKNMGTTGILLWVEKGMEIVEVIIR